MDDHPHRAFEIREVRRDVGATVRLLPGGELIVLQDRKFSTCIRPLDLYCGRILTNGSRPQLLALPVLVTRDRRRDLLDLLASGPSAEQLAAFVGPQPDPYLQNSDGNDYTDAEVVLDVTGYAERSWRRLSDRLVRTDTHTLERHGERDGKTVSLGQVNRVGRRWTRNANSRERLAALEALVRAEAPTVREVSRRAERRAVSRQATAAGSARSWWTTMWSPPTRTTSCVPLGSPGWTPLSTAWV